MFLDPTPPDFDYAAWEATAPAGAAAWRKWNEERGWGFDFLEAQEYGVCALMHRDPLPGEPALTEDEKAWLALDRMIADQRWTENSEAAIPFCKEFLAGKRSIRSAVEETEKKYYEDRWMVDGDT